LLQARLGVFELADLGKRGDPPGKQPRDHRLRGGESAVEKDRTAERFQRIGQNRLAAKAAARELARPELQRLPESQRARHFGERLATHEPGAQPTQVPFGRLRKGLVEDRKSTRLNSSHQIISYPVLFSKK